MTILSNFELYDNVWPKFEEIFLVFKNNGLEQNLQLKKITVEFWVHYLSQLQDFAYNYIFNNNYKE